MPATDHCEPAIVRALQRAGWLITHQPYAIRTDRTRWGYIFVDLRLRHNTAEDDTIIVVEVKCFDAENVFWSDFYRAIGQYIVYRNALLLNQLSIPVYLALPLLPFLQKFSDALVQSVIHDLKINFIVVDLQTEEIVQWTRSNE